MRSGFLRQMIVPLPVPHLIHELHVVDADSGVLVRVNVPLAVEEVPRQWRAETFTAMLYLVLLMAEIQL